MKSLSVFIAICLAQPCWSMEKPFVTPFQTGEKMTYSVGWKNATAGSINIAVDKIVLRNNREAFHLLGAATTNALIDKVFPVNDRFESWMDKKKLVSLGYAVRIHEKDQMKNEVVFIDADKNTYKRLFTRPMRSQKQESSQGPVEPLVQDIVSSLYFIRTQPLRSDKPILLKCFYGGAVKLIKIVVQREEVVSFKGKKYTCAVLEPLFFSEGSYKPHPKGKFSIWMTNDAKRIPLKIAAELIIGSININLEQYTPN